MWMMGSPGFFKQGGPPIVYPTWDPATKGTYGTLSNGNLTFTGSAIATSGVKATAIGQNTGKYYYEVLLTTISSSYVGLYVVGAGPGGIDSNSFLGYSTETIGRPTGGTRIRSNGNKGTVGTAYSSGEVMGVLTDFTTNTISYTKNNTFDVEWVGFPVATWAPAISLATSATEVCTARFKPSDWSYTPPAGYVAWTT